MTIIKKAAGVANTNHQARAFNYVILNRMAKRRKCFKSLKAENA